MPLTLSLPGLFDFTTGVNSAIAQERARFQNDSLEAASFVDQLNAFNTGLNTNDNLQFRRDFASQPEGTSILDRFTNISQNTSNPFVLNQAAVQGNALAPLLAQSSLSNPFFAQSQGLPTTAQGALDQGLLGFNPIFQQQFNQQIPSVLAQGNPGVDTASLAATLLAANQQNAANNGAVESQEQVRQLQSQVSTLLEALSRSNVQNVVPVNGVNTAAPPAAAVSVSSALPLSRGN